MIDFNIALELVGEIAQTLNSTSVPVVDSVGYILDEDIYSPLDMPPFVKSAMDGYAFKNDLKDYTKIELKNIGIVAAGDFFTGEVRSDECISIMTGAPLPDSTDTVIPIENTEKEGELINFNKNLTTGTNVCQKGEDISKGALILEKGSLLKSSHIALISAAGYKNIKVIRKPKIAILNTGSEIIEPGEELKSGQIYNSNGQMLQAMCNDLNYDAEYIGIAVDTKETLKKAIMKGLEYDILLISGGVSMGEFDLVPGMLKESGVDKVFHKVKIKPGKPLFFGKHSNGLVFGLPGNPLSNFVGFTLFVTTAVKKMSSLSDIYPEFKTGTLTKEFRQRSGRRNFFPATIKKNKDEYLITPVNSNGSADIMSLSKADGFLIAHEDLSVLKEGETTEFILF
ncbi:MAG: molybdopterin molybdotransferase MoeA [Candidatus Delongbacteria bacterium]|jgi:molybdopterin molybdotransferase|nr:molybdopterin molybdotransferase MoeA [Candidatus Delongbacteria bacterium]